MADAELEDWWEHIGQGVFPLTDAEFEDWWERVGKSLVAAGHASELLGADNYREKVEHAANRITIALQAVAHVVRRSTEGLGAMGEDKEVREALLDARLYAAKAARMLSSEIRFMYEYCREVDDER